MNEECFSFFQPRSESQSPPDRLSHGGKGDLEKGKVGLYVRVKGERTKEEGREERKSLSEGVGSEEIREPSVIVKVCDSLFVGGFEQIITKEVDVVSFVAVLLLERHGNRGKVTELQEQRRSMRSNPTKWR